MKAKTPYVVILSGILLCLIGSTGFLYNFITQKKAADYYSAVLENIILPQKEEVNTEIKEKENTVTVDNTDNINSSVLPAETENISQSTEATCNEKSITDNYISIRDTSITYPLVQGDDNSYYLTHLPNKEKNKYGSIFIDYKNNPEDFNVIIYGHNMKDGSMFGQLSNYYNIDGFADKHSEMTICWNGKTNNYKLFSVQKVQFDSEVYLINPDNKKEWIDNQKNASVVNFKEDVSVDAEFVTLSTCGSTKTEKVVTIWKKY